LTEAIARVGRDRNAIDATLHELHITGHADPAFRAPLLDQLGKLEACNCARFRLTLTATQAWIAADRCA